VDDVGVSVNDAVDTDDVMSWVDMVDLMAGAVVEYVVSQKSPV